MSTSRSDFDGEHNLRDRRINKTGDVEVESDDALDGSDVEDVSESEKRTYGRTPDGTGDTLHTFRFSITETVQ